MRTLARSIPFSTPPMTIAITIAMKTRWKPMAGSPLAMAPKWAPGSEGKPEKTAASA